MKRPTSGRVSTASLLRLAVSEEPELVAAASLILGALRPKDPKVISILTRALERADTPLKPYLLDALAKFGTKKSFAPILPYLLVQGSLREQAIRLATDRGPEIISELRRLSRENSFEDRSIFLRIAGSISGREAIDFIMDALPEVTFEQGKSILTSIGHRADSMTATDRRHIAKRLFAFLDAPPSSNEVTGEITALKLLACLRTPKSTRRLIARIGPDHPQVVRANALEALLAVVLSDQDGPVLMTALRPLLTGPNPAHAALAFRILRRLEPKALGLDDILVLTNSPHSELARLAFAELRHFDRDTAVSTLFDGLLKTDDAIADTAASSLGQIPIPIEDLVRAHEDPRFRAKREALRGIIAERNEKLTPARFRLLVRTLLEDGLGQDAFTSRLLVLATIDRSALNHMVEARARLALKRRDATRALLLLEPLVRGRLAAPRGRYLLAMAHLQLHPSAESPNSAHFERAMNLISPLARLPDWSLKTQLLRELHVPKSHLGLLAHHLSARPEPERSLALVLRDRLG